MISSGPDVERAGEERGRTGSRVSFQGFDTIQHVRVAVGPSPFGTDRLPTHERIAIRQQRGRECDARAEAETLAFDQHTRQTGMHRQPCHRSAEFGDRASRARPGVAAIPTPARWRPRAAARATGIFAYRFRRARGVAAPLPPDRRGESPVTSAPARWLCDASLHSRMQIPGRVRPARPAR